MTKMTYAFYLQSALSLRRMLFVLGGIYFLPADGWVRAFLGLGALFLVNSSSRSPSASGTSRRIGRRGRVAPYR